MTPPPSLFTCPQVQSQEAAGAAAVAAGQQAEVGPAYPPEFIRKRWMVFAGLFAG